MQTADETSVFYDNDKNSAQIRSVIRYQAQIKEKLASLQEGSEAANAEILTLKRLTFVECGIKLVRAQNAPAKDLPKSMLEQFRRLVAQTEAPPAIPDFRMPEFLTNLSLRYMAEGEFGEDITRSGEFADALEGNAVPARWVRCGIVALLREQKKETIDVVRRMSLGLTAADPSGLVSLGGCGFEEGLGVGDGDGWGKKRGWV